MHKFQIRLISLLVCVTMFCGCFPAISEDEISAVIEDAVIIETTPDEEYETEDTDHSEVTDIEDAEVDTTETIVVESVDATAHVTVADVASDLIIAMKNDGISGDLNQSEWLYRTLISRAEHGTGNTAEDALVAGHADPTGYAEAFATLLNMAGIKNRIVCDANDPSIAWNTVQINGIWTNIDVYADDETGKTGRCFGLTDAAMMLETGHTAVKDYACTDSSVNYAVLHEGYIALESAEALSDIIFNNNESNQLKLYNTTGLPAETLFANITAEGILIEESGCYIICNIENIDLTAVETLANASIIPVTNSYTLGVGDKRTIAYTVVPSSSEVTFYSSAPDICSVTNKGVMTALKAGSATITLAINGAIATIKVKVVAGPTKITGVSERYNSTDKTIYVGRDETIIIDYSTVPASAKDSAGVVFTIGKESIATISSIGELTGHAVGSTTLRLTCYNGINASTGITVVSAPTGITNDAKELTLGVGETYTLNPVITGDAHNIFKPLFVSDNTAVASVSDSGKITAKAIGDATITATTYNGHKVDTIVHVTAAPKTITLNAPFRTMGVGDTMQMEYALQPEGSTCSVTWSSSSSKIASISKTGLVTAKKAGSVTITAKTNNGLTAILKLTVKAGVSSVALNIPVKAIGVGDTVQTSYTLKGYTNNFKYTSLKPDIATVDDSGVITGVKVGTTSIKIQAGKSKTATASIEVKAAPTSVTYAKDELLLALGDSFTPGYTLSANSAGSVSYESGNPSVASVDSDGKITAKSIGETVITISTYNGKTDTCTVTVTSALSEVSMRADQTTIGVGEKFRLSTTVKPAGVDTVLKYSTSNSKIISVDETGLITAKKTGSATITVTGYNGKSASAKFTVKKLASSVRFSAAKDTIGIGETISTACVFPSGTYATITSYQTSPENNAAADIDENGMITGLSTGTVQLKAVTYKGKSSNVITIRVVPAPESVMPERENVTVSAGDSITLGYTFNSGASGAVSMTSSRPSVCTANDDGTITGIAPGNAVITLTTHNGKTATCNVTVMPQPTSIQVSAERTTIGVAENMQINVSILPEGSTGKCTFTSSKTSILTVDANGEVRGKKAGSATVTVRTYNGKTATLKFTIKKAPSSLKITSARTTLGVGETIQVSCQLSSGSVGAITSAISENTNVLTVDADGTVTAKAPGTARIRLTTYNGVKSNLLTFTVASAPASITPDVSEIVIGAKETYKLGYKLSSGTAGAVSFASDNTGIATVDSTNGTITGVSAGTCNIRLVTYNGKEAECNVTVKAAPTSINLTAKQTTIGIGQALQLQPSILPDNAAAVPVYTTSAKSVATVSESGVVTAKKSGTVKITATTYNGLKSTITLRVVSAPSAVKFSTTSFSIGIDESVDLSGYVMVPAKTAAGFKFESSNPGICRIDPETGNIVGVATGNATVRVSTHNGKTATCSVRVGAAPVGISLETPDTMVINQTAQARTTLIASTAVSFSLRFEVISGSNVITVTDAGVITAKAVGEATLRVRTYKSDVYADRRITVKKAPTFVKFDKSEYTVSTGSTLQLNPIIDTNAVTTFTYEIAKAGYFTISETGLITPISRGSTKVRVTTHNGLTATATVTVVDPYFPESIAWTNKENNPPTSMSTSSSSGLLTSWKPDVTATPSSAQPAMEWQSSDSSVLRYNEAAGTFTAVSYGVVTVTGTSTRNPSLTLSARIVVSSNSTLSGVTPTEYVNVSGMSSGQIRALISENESVANDVLNSAYSELTSLVNTKQISSSEASARKTIINRAFGMLNFPWQTPSKVSYWTSSYDSSPYNHSKDYRTGILYFGLPYTQTYRNYNNTKIVSEGWFTSGSNHYNLNTSKFTGRNYRGNDCSSFVSQCERGGSNYDNTTAIASSSFYTTLDKSTYATKMRPGDILVHSGHHVVMFLYYTNAAKTQFMIIEQGGSDDYHTNVVACRVKDMSKYSKYTLRRPKL